MRTIAFYLPQFHPFAENDEWWGKGFTEWTNVAKSKSLFNGHYQPQIPADLGFYDLRLPEAREAQANLAQQYGVDAFCYYHYWFNGQMLMEKPFLEVLHSGAPNHDFCLCWANENWTRRWDGLNHEILMEQNYETYDPEEHMQWLAQAFQDQRYIQINGAPLFLIYRASDIPNLKEIILRWRKAAKKQGFDKIHLCCANNSQNILSREQIIDLGFDSIYEFAPNLKSFEFDEQLSLSNIPGLNIYSYPQMVEKELQKQPNDDIVTFPCVFPSWDNSPRRGNNATVIQNEDAQVYYNWLRKAIDNVKSYSSDEQIVFINAWNEWAEGCHLEPDLKHGKKFLEATFQAVNGLPFQAQTSSNIKSQTAIVRDMTVRIDQKRPIYIWGAGSSGQQALNILKRAGIAVTAFIDSNPEKAGTLFCDVPVISKQQLLDITSLKPFVCIASIFYEEIQTSLNTIGLSKNADYITNILQCSISIQQSEERTYYIFESGTYCNICGSGKFQADHSSNIKCSKCMSNSEERMLIELLSEELGISSLPLSQWTELSHLKMLSIDALSKSNTFFQHNLDMTFKTDLNLDNQLYKFDFILLRIPETLQISTSVISFIQHTKSYLFPGGKLIILMPPGAENLIPAIRQEFHSYYIEREYSRFKTHIQKVIIIH